MTRIQWSLALAILFGLSSAGWAVTIPVSNFSFENPALPNGDYQGDGSYPYPWTIPGWGSNPALPNYPGAGVQNFIGTGAYGGGATLPGTADGKQAVYVNGNDVYQDVGPLKPNTTYTLTVAAGNQPGYGPGSTGAIELVNGTTDTGTVLSSTSLPASGTPGGIPISTFADFVTSFKSGASVSGDLTIVLAKTSGNQVDYDNVRLTSVPEPSSLALLIAGLLGLAIAASRRAR